jgi:hypothetical protein
MRYKLTYLLFFLLLNYGYAQHPVINEVMFSNASAFENGNGDYLPWIEIYNPGNYPVQLNNYFLSSNPANLQQWQLPDFLLQPGNFYVVFAAGVIDELNSSYSSISLVNGQSHVLLSNFSGVVVSRIEERCVSHNHSLGRSEDGIGTPVVFAHSTPGFSNLLGEWAPIPAIRTEVKFSHDGGFYAEPIAVKLFTDLENVEILYTINTALLPETTSEPFDSAIFLIDRSVEPNNFAEIVTTSGADQFFIPQEKITKSNVIRAIAYKNGCPVSEVATRNYFINLEGKNVYDVNVVSVVADPNDLFANETGIYVQGNYQNYTQRGEEWERNAHLEVYNSDGESVLDQRIGIRIHGGGTREAPQKSLRLYARSEYGTNTFNAQLFEDKTIFNFKRLLLRTTMGDWKPNVFKDELCHELVKDLNVDYMASSPAIVFLNGEYWGIQNLRERQDKFYLQSNHNLIFPEVDIIKYDIHVGAVVEDGDAQTYNELINFIETNDLTQNEVYAEFNELVDMDNLIDFLVSHLYLANMDFPNRNFGMWKPRQEPGKWRWLFFDCDACMIRSNYNHLSEYLQSNPSMQRFPAWSTQIVRAVFANEEFKQRFYSRFQQVLQNDFSPDKVLETIEVYERKFEPLMAEHIQRWKIPNDINQWKHTISELRVFALQRPLEMQQILNQYFDNPFLVYPNPSSGSFSIDFLEAKGNRSMDIYNVHGVRLKTYQFNDLESGIVFINSQLLPGMYILKALIGNRFYSQKLIVQ